MRRKLFIIGLIILTSYILMYSILELKEVLFTSIIIVFILVTNYVLYRKRKLTKKQFIAIFLSLLFGALLFFNEHIKYLKVDEFFYEDRDSYVGEITDIILKEEGLYQLTIKPKALDLKVIGYYESYNEVCDVIGGEYLISGEIVTPDTQRNPGCFNYRLYLKSKSICRIQYIDNMVLKDNGNILDKFKQNLIKRRYEFLDVYEDRGIIGGLVFGDKNCMKDEIYEKFKANGISHILAVSGLHIGIVYGFFLVIIRGNRRKIYGLVFLLILLSYGTMTIWPPSCCRAIFMVMLNMISYYYDRRFDTLAALTLAFMVFSIMNPYIIFNIGFKLSFIAVLGICFVTPKLKIYVGNYLSTILAAQITLIPIIAYEMNYISLISPIANLIIVPIVAVLMPIIIIHLLIFTITGFKLIVISKVAISISELIIYLNDIIYKYNNLIVDVITLNFAMIFIYYIIILFITSETFIVLIKRKKNTFVISIILLTMLISIPIHLITKNDFKDDEVVFIDVGQGDGIHIRTDELNVLIDGGGHYMKNIGQMVLKPYLLKNGVFNLDMAIPTHLHMDHFKGVSELKEIYLIDKLMVFEGYMPIIESDRYLKVGDKIVLGKEIYIEILWPILSEGDSFDLEDENKVNMVIKLKYEGVDILITGDLLAQGEKEMLKYYEDTDKLKCDILKVCHHGSKSSTTDEFLNVVEPKVAIIQVGKNNYEHPADNTIEKLYKKDIMVFRNDLDGAIGIDIKNGKYYIKKMI